MSRQQKIQEIEILEALKTVRHDNLGRKVYESFYGWQRRFNKATADYSSCMLMAANQVGKSQTGCSIDSYHLTGEYPEDWEGHKFDFPPMLWLLGFSMEKTRDLLQAKLFGKMVNGEFEGGYIQKDKIVDHILATGTKGACREVRVQHKAGIATVQFWSYSQGQHAIMGDVVDWYHIDEEPRDAAIFPQVLTRTLNGDRGKGGKGILTFTPENGKTELVCQFMGDNFETEEGEEAQDFDIGSQYLQTATWDDAPHLSEEIKKKILSIYPAYQRDMRSKGIPLMGAGLIFEHDQKDISCQRFEIPNHWWLIDGMDFGWDHPQAHIQLAIDPDNGITYVTHAYKKSKTFAHDAWHVIKHWAEGVPTAWPQDGLQTRENGKEKRDFYIESDFDMCDDHATWEGGGVGVELGLVMMNKEFALGTLKVFSDLHEVFEEIREYHRKSMPSGISQIVKLKDDLIDAIRYAIMMRREAIQKVRLSEGYEDDYHDIRETNAGGY